MTKLDDLDVFKLMQRLERFEKTDVEERLRYIEEQLKYFVMAATEMKDRFRDGIKISIDQNSLNIATQLSHMMKQSLSTVQDEVLAMKRLRKDITHEYERMVAQQKVNLMENSVSGALKYMAKQLTELAKEVSQIKEEGIKKQITLDVTMEGYEMVKRKPPRIAPPEDEQAHDPESDIKELFKTLLPREVLVLTHRFGLFGQKKSTLDATGKIIKLSRERVRAIQEKALMKCRHPSRRELMDEITHKELRLAILGE